MSYTALYRKWRPLSFDEVKGQDHIVKTLKNQIMSERVGHAYLFCGTRGTGKTSIAKIFAKAVNCEHPLEGSPCGECAMCRQIGAGASLNVVEIDAASNNGVENIREIREQVQYPPTEGKYRVYIIDEVHMLSIGAFNALLKTLEEPPEYVIFILATTEVHKIPITILSRCQRYDFRRITIDTITEHLQELVGSEGIEVEERALRYVAKTADGSMRDALSLLDQCAAFHFGEKLTYDNVLEVLGAVDNSVFSSLFRSVIKGAATECIYKIEEMIVQGRELSQFVTDFIWYMRNLLIIKTSDDSENMLDMSMDNLKLLKEEAELTDGETLMRYIRVFSDLSGKLRFANQKRVLVEIAFIKLTRPAMEQNLDSVLQRLTELEKRLDEMPENLSASAAFSAPPGEAAADGGIASGARGAEGKKNEPSEPVVLPKAQYEDLMMLRGEWAKISRQMGGPMRAALKDTVVEPSGEGCLSIVCADINSFSIINREVSIAALKELVEKNYGKSLEFMAKYNEEGRPLSTVYVSEDDMKVIHDEVIYED